MSNEQHATTHDDDMQSEYDFSDKHAVRGKYYQRLRDGYTIKIQQEDGTTLIPVSYTHLDVYKRQRHDRS